MKKTDSHINFKKNGEFDASNKKNTYQKQEQDLEKQKKKKNRIRKE